MGIIQGNLFDDGQVHDARFLSSEDLHRENLRKQACESKKQSNKRLLDWFDSEVEMEDDFTRGYHSQDAWDRYPSYGSSYSIKSDNRKFGSWWNAKNNEDSIVRPHIEADTEVRLIDKLYDYLIGDIESSDWNATGTIGKYGFNTDEDEFNDVEISEMSHHQLMATYNYFVGSLNSKYNYSTTQYFIKCIKSFLVLKTDLVTKKEFDMMLVDIFKNFNCKNLKFEIANDKHWWFDILSENDNYMLKMLCNESYLQSMVIAKHAIINLLANIFDFENSDCEKEEGEKEGDGLGNNKNRSWNTQIPGNGNPDEQPGEGEDGNPSEQEGNQGNGKQLSKNKKEAFDKAISEINDKQKAAEMFGSSLAGLGSEEKVEEFEDMVNQMGKVNVNKRLIEKFINKSIKNMKTSLRGCQYMKQESFLDSDDMIDIPDAHLLNTLELVDDMDVMVAEHSMKYNLYIDISGSMSGNIYLGQDEDGNSQYMNRMTLAKILAFKMKTMNVLNDVYGFDNEVEKVDRNKIAWMSYGGGTSIDNVIDHIAQTGIPSMVISDGDDTVHKYDPKAYIMTICSNVRGPAMMRFAKNKQTVFFKDNKFLYGKCINNSIVYEE